MRGSRLQVAMVGLVQWLARRATASFIITGLLAAGACGRAAENRGPEPNTQAATTAAAAVNVERGKHLVTVLACGDCHTPFKMGAQGPEPDMERFLAGHPADLEMPPPPRLQHPWGWVGAATNTAFAGPWGITYATNLTPEDNTGLGIWTEEMFVRALKTGRHMGTSRSIMPPMPWTSYSQLSEEDLRSMYRYLRTIAPIENRVPEYVPPLRPRDVK
jgi:mono/diheme cytochrome c family protein